MLIKKETLFRFSVHHPFSGPVSLFFTLVCEATFSEASKLTTLLNKI